MTDTKTTVRVGPGFPALLTILFIALKLTDNIDWSWWWVLSPLWIGAAFIACFFVIGITIAVIAAVVQDAEKKRRRKKFDKIKAERAKMRVDRLR